MTYCVPPDGTPSNSYHYLVLAQIRAIGCWDAHSMIPGLWSLGNRFFTPLELWRDGVRYDGAVPEDIAQQLHADRARMWNVEAKLAAETKSRRLPPQDMVTLTLRLRWVGQSLLLGPIPVGNYRYASSIECWEVIRSDGVWSSYATEAEARAALEAMARGMGEGV